MKVFDDIKSKNIDELAEWLDKYGAFDNSPWVEYFNENYCRKCEPESDYGYCELNGNCKFFKHMSEIPSCKDMVKLWLKSEI